jgi:hypothetical protein
LGSQRTAPEKPQGLEWVKGGKVQNEQMFSGLCLKADARGIMRDGPRRRAEPSLSAHPKTTSRPMAQQILRLPELVRIAKGIDRSCDLYLRRVGRSARASCFTRSSNQNQTANNTAADTQVMSNGRSHPTSHAVRCCNPVSALLIAASTLSSETVGPTDRV